MQPLLPTPVKQGLTRLNATAQGTPFSAAFSSANSSAQLSAMRWSRDILGGWMGLVKSSVCVRGRGNLR